MNDITALVAGDEAATTHKGVPHEIIISDRNFLKQLQTLMLLKQFLFDEKAVVFDEKKGSRKAQLDDVDLNELNNIYLPRNIVYLILNTIRRNGRRPYYSEWCLLDEKMLILSSYLNQDDLRQKFRIRELGQFFFIYPLVFLAVSFFASLCEVIHYQLTDSQQLLSSSLTYYVAYWLILHSWCGAQGGLGACAFLGTSAIVKASVDDGLLNATKSRELVDLTDRNFLRIRILMGVLFGLLFGGPFATQAFEIGNTLFFKHSTSIDYNIAIMFVPFLIGFSTNLVLVILRRLVVSIETFFGLPSRT